VENEVGSEENERGDVEGVPTDPNTYAIIF
jgi:hypothetical protein